LLAKMEGEFNIKTLPTAAKIEPMSPKIGYWYSIKVLIQTPVMTISDPTMQPIFMPNLSKTQLAGKAQTGCKIGNIKVKRVTITEL
jgi:hypothetical protein